MAAKPRNEDSGAATEATVTSTGSGMAPGPEAIRNSAATSSSDLSTPTNTMESQRSSSDSSVPATDNTGSSDSSVPATDNTGGTISDGSTSSSSVSSCSTATPSNPPILDPFNPDEEVQEEFNEETFAEEYAKALKADEEALNKLPSETREYLKKGDSHVITRATLFQKGMTISKEEWDKEDADYRIDPTEGREQQCNQQEKIVTELDASLKDVGSEYPRQEEPRAFVPKHSDCENHRWYPAVDPREKMPKDKILNLIARESPETIARFIKHFDSQQEVVAEFQEDHPENATVYSTIAPSDRSVLYMAVEHRSNSVYLTPIHLEVVGGCRPSLHLLTLNARTFDMASEKFFNLEEIEPGDIFYVHEIVPNPRKERQPMITDMKDIHDPKIHKFWKIQKATRVPRTVLKNKLAHHWIPKDSSQYNAYIVEDLVAPALLAHKLVPKKAKDKREQWLEVTVMTPPVQPGRNLRGFNPGGEEEEALDLFRPHCPLWNIGPRIVEAESLRERLRELVDEGVMQFQQDGQLHNRYFSRAARLIKFGVYAQTAMVNFRHDPRSYAGSVISANTSQFGHTLEIDLKNPEAFPIQAAQWRVNTMVTIKRKQTIVPGKIRSATDYQDGRFKVIIQLAKRYQMDLLYYDKQRVFVQHKSQDTEEYLRMQIGKMEPPEYKANMTAMRIMAATLGAERIVDPDEGRLVTPYIQGEFQSTQEQGKVLAYMEDQLIPGAIIHCAFGAGKTTTLVTALLHYQESLPMHWVAYTAQSNMAVVQAVKTWMKWDPDRQVRAVRLMSAANRDRLDQTQHTFIDLPVLLWQVLKADFHNFNYAGIQHTPLQVSITRHLVAKQRILKREIHSRKLRDACLPSYKKEPPAHGIYECFIRVYRPTLFFGTTTSLRQAFSNNDYMHTKKDKIRIICIDEASQMPRASFTAVVITFPRARMFLTGDSKQLPPYEETNTPKALTDFSGAWFQQAFDSTVLPIVSISRVFRCPPYTTKWLSECFYKNTLTPFKPLQYYSTELQRCGFPSKSPIQFINTVSDESKEGTSARNLKEALVCSKLVNELSRWISQKDLVVVCFYLSQVSLLTGILPRGVHVTTVDGVQGSEYDYVIVCTTRSVDFTKSKFINSKERTNVALSRSKQATVVLANLSATHNTRDCWKKVIDKVPPEAKLSLSQLPRLNPAKYEIEKLTKSLRSAEHTSEQVSDRGIFSPRR